MESNNFDNFLDQVTREQKQKDFYSVLDNIETFRQILSFSNRNISSKKDFYLLYYRRKNLQIKRNLEKSTKAENEIIKKTCKSLACCSSLSQLVENVNVDATIEKTSRKCKNRYCLICSRILSNKKVQQFKSKLNNPDHIDYFKKRHFYFLTVTLKHDAETRNFNYLNEFRENLTKLFRSVLFKNVFIQSKDKNNYGQMNSIEMTISKNLYHIHSHALICCLPLKSNITEIEKMLSKKWKEITKDSTIIRLDLIKNLKFDDNDDLDNNESEDVFNAISETFKYSVKSESLTNMKFNDVELIADWIIETKGKNFINAYGYFRKLKLGDTKHEKDENENEEIEIVERNEYLTRTIDIKTNANLNSNYNKNTRKQMLSYFKIIGVDNQAHMIDNDENDLHFLLNDFREDEILNTFLPEAVIANKESHNKFRKMKEDMDIIIGEQIKTRKINSNIGMSYE